MPTYEYACPKCGQQFEHFQSMRDEPLKKCLKCGKSGVKRLVGKGAGLIFKGTGFYITDYKKKSGGEAKPAEPAKTDGKAPAESAAKPETKAPAAPAPASAPTPAPAPAPKTRSDSAKKQHHR